MSKLLNFFKALIAPKPAAEVSIPHAGDVKAANHAAYKKAVAAFRAAKMLDLSSWCTYNIPRGQTDMRKWLEDKVCVSFGGQHVMFVPEERELRVIHDEIVDLLLRNGYVVVVGTGKVEGDSLIAKQRATMVSMPTIIERPRR